MHDAGYEGHRLVDFRGGDSQHPRQQVRDDVVLLSEKAHFGTLPLSKRATMNTMQ